MNDYSGMLLHEAKLRDHIKEARGGRMIHAARPVDKVRRSRLARRRLASRLLWLAALAAMRLTAG
jgi:hypothetical protein